MLNRIIFNETYIYVIMLYAPGDRFDNTAPPDQKVERDEFASILMKVGLKRNVAKVLTYLAGVAEATSREIEIGSDLRQPEVSIAMREIRKLDWISERDEKNPGKGRPYRIYKLKKKPS